MEGGGGGQETEGQNNNAWAGLSSPGFCLGHLGTNPVSLTSSSRDGPARTTDAAGLGSRMLPGGVR